MEGHRSNIRAHPCSAHIAQPEQYTTTANSTATVGWSCPDTNAQTLFNIDRTFVTGRASGSTKNGAC